MGLSTPGGSGYRERVIADGASHYWRLGETTGTTAADTVGTAHGTISGGVTLGQPGALADGNPSMLFNGTTGKIVTTPIAVPLLGTVEAWIKPTVAEDYRAVCSTRFAAANTRMFGTLESRPICYADGATPPQANGADGVIVGGQWRHVVYIHDGSTCAFYVNGMAAGSGPQAIGAQVPTVVGIGANPGGSTFFKGQIQDVATYPHALAPADIAAHYALRTAVPVLPTTQAYTWARSGIARSDATRSNYVTAWSTVDLIVRDEVGNIISRTDLTNYIRHGSLQVTQALNDEADTCSFQIVPTAPPEAVPQVGQEIAVAWTPGAVEFRGYALVVQFDRRAKNESPWVSVQCQDAMWRFDARIVTYHFPAQSVSESIAFLVQWFCNLRGYQTNVGDFRTTFVQPGMPSIPAFDVVNQRPSTVMRTLMAAVQGGFYLDGLDVHAWAGSLSEPAQTNPQPLTNTLTSLKAFRVTHDATQLRRRVLVEGRRTATAISLPVLSTVFEEERIGVALQDATLFDLTAPTGFVQRIRLGTQWMYLGIPVSVTASGANPPQTKTFAAFLPSDLVLTLRAMPMAPPVRGWVRIGNQFARYDGIIGSPAVDGWQISLPDPMLYPHYGTFTIPIAADEVVEWIDGAMSLLMHGLTWDDTRGLGDPFLRAHPVETPVVTLAMAQRTPIAPWPALEGFVQDGRYSYAGALARAEADLDAFSEPLVSAEWETEDLNAQPGRLQAINLTGTSVIDPLTLSLTITRVEISFPLRNQPPRRRCTGGDVKPSTFLDLVLTDES